MPKKVKKKIDRVAKNIIDWLDTKWWFLPKDATGFKVLISFPRSKNAKKEFLDVVVDKFGFKIDKQNKQSIVLKKGSRTTVGTIRLANSLFMKGFARSAIRLLPNLQRFGIEAQFKQEENKKYVRFIITPFMELFDMQEKFFFSQDITESIADEIYTRNYAKKIIKALESKNGKKLRFCPTGPTWWGKSKRKKL